MSDGTAPVEAAPVEAVETAPAEGKPVEKPRTEADDYDEFFKKKPIKFKAGGKEHSISSHADPPRKLSKVAGMEAAASEALKVKRERADLDAKVRSLAKMAPRDRLKALEEMGIPRATVMEALEEDILGTAAEREAAAQMTERERELQAKLKDREAALEKHENERKEWEQRHQQEQETAEADQLYGELSESAAKALQTAKISPEHANHFLPSLAQAFDRAKRLGLDVDGADLAEVVVKQHGSLARGYYSGLDVNAHLEELRSMEMPDPADPSKTTNRLKLMLLAEAARIRSRHSPQSSPVTHIPAQPRQQREPTLAEKLASHRTFGSGG